MRALGESGIYAYLERHTLAFHTEPLGFKTGGAMVRGERVIYYVKSKLAINAGSRITKSSCKNSPEVQVFNWAWSDVFTLGGKFDGAGFFLTWSGWGRRRRLTQHPSWGGQCS